MGAMGVLLKTTLFAKMKPFALRNASYTKNRDLKRNEISRRVEPMGLGGMDTMLGKRNCRVGSCSRAALTTLDRQPLSLNHFLLRSSALPPTSSLHPTPLLQIPDFLHSFIRSSSVKFR